MCSPSTLSVKQDYLYHASVYSLGIVVASTLIGGIALNIIQKSTQISTILLMTSGSGAAAELILVAFKQSQKEPPVRVASSNVVEPLKEKKRKACATSLKEQSEITTPIIRSPYKKFRSPPQSEKASPTRILDKKEPLFSPKTLGSPFKKVKATPSMPNGDKVIFDPPSTPTNRHFGIVDNEPALQSDFNESHDSTVEIQENATDEMTYAEFSTHIQQQWLSRDKNIKKRSFEEVATQLNIADDLLKQLIEHYNHKFLSYNYIFSPLLPDQKVFEDFQISLVLFEFAKTVSSL